MKPLGCPIKLDAHTHIYFSKQDGLWAFAGRSSESLYPFQGVIMCILWLPAI